MPSTSRRSLKGSSHVSECFLCQNVYRNPRILPCIHSFCLSCLQNYARHSKPGQLISCPCCQKAFEIPEGGIANLPGSACGSTHTDRSNPFSGSRISDAVLCAICETKNPSDHDSGDASGGHDRETSQDTHSSRYASKYCIDCRQEMCLKCAVLHLKMKISRHHNIVDLQTRVQAERFKSIGSATCSTHDEEPLKMFCFQCNTAICMTCYAEIHSRHNCLDVSSAAEILATQLQCDLDVVRDRKLECQNALDIIRLEKKQLLSEFKNAEDAINKRYKEQILRVEVDRTALVKQLTDTNDSTIRQITNLQQELERRIDAMEGYETSILDVRDKNIPIFTVAVAKEMHKRAEDLQAISKGPPLVVYMSALKPRREDKLNMLGTVSLSKKYFYQTAKLPKGSKPIFTSTNRPKQTDVNNSSVSMVLGVIIIPLCLALFIKMLM